MSDEDYKKLLEDDAPPDAGFCIVCGKACNNYQGKADKYTHIFAHEECEATYMHYHHATCPRMIGTGEMDEKCVMMECVCWVPELNKCIWIEKMKMDYLRKKDECIRRHATLQNFEEWRKEAVDFLGKELEGYEREAKRD